MNKENLLTNAWISIGISFLIGLVLALIFQSNWLPAFALGFAITREIMNVVKQNIVKETNNRGKIEILKRFATEKLGQTRYVVNQQNINSIIPCLASLEYILTEISKCCDISNGQLKFKKVKGMVSDTKTTFDKSRFDSSIQKPFGDAITCVTNIETYINDL